MRMILRNEKTFGNSHDDYDFFMCHYGKIHPIKSIQVYFQSENFLLTKYNVENGTTFVAEGWNGNEIHLTGINCGYGGTGPSRMADILVHIGIPQEKAMELKYYNELRFDFDHEDKLINEFYSNSPFFGHTDESPVTLDSFTYVEFESKKLYFINPQFHNMAGVYAAINKFKPHEFQYYIGSMSPLNNYYQPNTNYNFSRENITGVNLILRSSQFEMLFLLNEYIARSFINVIHYYIYGKSLFYDTEFTKLPSFLNLFYQIIKKEDKTCYGVKEIKRWEGKNGMDQ